MTQLLTADCLRAACGIARSLVSAHCHLFFIESVLIMSGREVASGSSASGGSEPEPKRRKLLNAGGPVEDDETARQKTRDAEVYERGVDGTNGEYVGFDPDNVAGVKSAVSLDADAHNYNAITPMGYFARYGDLPMMRWLYVNGADTRDVDVDFNFPMYRAAFRGHLEACKWLFAHGAAKDVKRRNHYGDSPLRISFVFSNQRDLNRWLILKGALCKDDDSGDLDVEIMKRDIDPKYAHRYGRVQERKALLEWAADLHRARTSLLLFLSGALSRPEHTYSTRRSSSAARMLSGKSGVLELIGDYVGFVRGREARIIRQLTELLPDVNKELDSK